MKMLHAKELHLWRGDRQVLCGVSFAINAGQCLQVTGANGAGKTTLLRALCGLLPLEAGEVQWCGQPASADWLAFHGDLAWASHHGGLKGDLTAVENLRYGATLGRTPSLTAAECLLETGMPVGLHSRLARQLSAGQQRRVTLARVLLQGCALWVLDEPASNLDGAGQQLVSALLRAHLDRGGLAVVATHHALELQQQSLVPLVLK
jgi:heme exporter protein A